MRPGLVPQAFDLRNELFVQKTAGFKLLPHSCRFLAGQKPERSQQGSKYIPVLVTECTIAILKVRTLIADKYGLEKPEQLKTFPGRELPISHAGAVKHGMKFVGFRAMEHLPRRRVVIRFHFPDVPEEQGTYWLIVKPGADVDLCQADPGFDVDVYVDANLKALISAWMVR